VVDGDGPAEATAKLSTLLDGDPKAEPIAERIAQLIGLDDAVGPVQDAAWAVRRLLEALARERLVVLVLDDLHWAEPTPLEARLLDGLVAGGTLDAEARTRITNLARWHPLVHRGAAGHARGVRQLGAARR
jgi:hypothetical protein